MSLGATTLGEADVVRLKAEGWSFQAGAVKVANGFVVLATDKRGNPDVLLLADPEKEPEKWPQSGQVELPL
ncbi:MAG TPA: hypothetical protein VHW03_10015 [Chthoniobacterales bacterium]|jgi:hypothetical protein|nr:hypothetical protein [Chthoniobacterales bacterium]